MKKNIVSLSLIASTTLFGHQLFFDTTLFEGKEFEDVIQSSKSIINEKLDVLKKYVDDLRLDKRALSPLVGGSGDINNTVKDGVGYIIYYPYSEPNLNGYNKLVEECESDGCEDLTTTGCEDGYYFDGTSCQPIPPADNTCENGYGGDPYDGGIYCGYKGLTSLSPGWLNLKSVDGYLYLNNNYIEDLSNLSNLTRIDSYFSIKSNLLTSLNGLQNLAYVGYKIRIDGNSNLTDISGLNGITYVESIGLDYPPKTFDVKLSYDSWICQNIYDISFDSDDGDYIKSEYVFEKICETPCDISSDSMECIVYRCKTNINECMSLQCEEPISINGDDSAIFGNCGIICYEGYEKLCENPCENELYNIYEDIFSNLFRVNTTFPQYSGDGECEYIETTVNVPAPPPPPGPPPTPGASIKIGGGISIGGDGLSCRLGFFGNPYNGRDIKCDNFSVHDSEGTLSEEWYGRWYTMWHLGFAWSGLVSSNRKIILSNKCSHDVLFF